MWHDFDAIPDAAGPREGAGSMRVRLCRDIGLAAVAQALALTPSDLDDDLAHSVERGRPYLPAPAWLDLPAPAPAWLAA